MWWTPSNKIRATINHSQLVLIWRSSFVRFLRKNWGNCVTNEANWHPNGKPLPLLHERSLWLLWTKRKWTPSMIICHLRPNFISKTFKDVGRNYWVTTVKMFMIFWDCWSRDHYIFVCRGHAHRCQGLGPGLTCPTSVRHKIVFKHLKLWIRKKKNAPIHPQNSEQTQAAASGTLEHWKSGAKVGIGQSWPLWRTTV